MVLPADSARPAPDLIEFWSEGGVRLDIDPTFVVGAPLRGECPRASLNYDLSSIAEPRFRVVHRLSRRVPGLMIYYRPSAVVPFEGEASLVATMARADLTVDPRTRDTGPAADAFP